MKTLYFAYGSNMATERMLERCPGAEQVDRVRLKDWAIQFRRVLTIVPEPGAEVLGALYGISDQNELALDRYEGWPTWYDKALVTVESTTEPGKTYEAMVYILNKDRQKGPDTMYLAVCLEGCRDWGIPEDYLLRAAKRAKLADRVRTSF